MSQPDDIRRFILDHYILPARERGEDTVTFSAQTIQRAMGLGIAAEEFCKALDTHLFLDGAIVTLIGRDGPPQQRTPSGPLA